MKKHESRKGRPAQPDTGPDLAGLINKVQQQLIVLEKKLDTLIEQSSKRPYEEKRYVKPFQRFEHTGRQPETRQDNTYRERILHKAVCGDCKKECEVPFKPSGGRPVYCKECFSLRKNKGPFNETRPIRPSDAAAPAYQAEKHSASEKPKIYKKKKVHAHKRK